MLVDRTNGVSFVCAIFVVATVVVVVLVVALVVALVVVVNGGLVIFIDFSTFRVDDDFNVVLVDGLNVTGSISSFGFIEKPVLTVATSVTVIFLAGGTETAPSRFVVGICSVAVIISSVSATN